MGEEGLTRAEAGFPHDSAVPQPPSRRVDALPCAQTPCAHMGARQPTLTIQAEPRNLNEIPHPHCQVASLPCANRLRTPPPGRSPGADHPGAAPVGRTPPPGRSSSRPHPAGAPGGRARQAPGRRPGPISTRNTTDLGERSEGRGTVGRAGRAVGRAGRTVRPLTRTPCPPAPPTPRGTAAGPPAASGLRAPGGLPRPVPHRATPSAHHPALESLI